MRLQRLSFVPPDDQHSFIVAYQAEGHERLLREGLASIQELAHPEDANEWPFVKEGLCLVAHSDVLAGGGTVEMDPERYIESVLDHLRMAECQSGDVRLRSEKSIKTLLGDVSLPVDGVPGIRMSDLEEITCRPGGTREQLVPNSDAYRVLSDTGNFLGVLNQEECHVECGADFVWFKDDLFLFWMRKPTGTDSVVWIRILSYWIDRSA